MITLFFSMHTGPKKDIAALRPSLLHLVFGASLHTVIQYNVWFVQ